MPSNSNSIGNLEISSLSLPNLNDRLRRIGTILSGLSAPVDTTQNAGANQLVLTVPGILAVQSNVTPLVQLAAAQSFTTMTGLLKSAPIGSNVTAQIFVGGVAWGPILTITAGSTSGTASVAAAGPIAAGSIIRLDITGVGALLTGVSFPGSDLTVLLQ